MRLAILWIIGKYVYNIIPYSRPFEQNIYYNYRLPFLHSTIYSTKLNHTTKSPIDWICTEALQTILLQKCGKSEMLMASKGHRCYTIKCMVLIYV